MTSDQLQEAIRDYPAHAGRPGYQYGLDDLDFEDFVTEFADYLAERIGEPSD